MTTIATAEDILNSFPDNFSSNWTRNTRDDKEPVVVLAQADIIHQDTPGDSNVESIYEDIDANYPGMAYKGTRPYVYEVWVTLDDLLRDEGFADYVYDILLVMEQVAIYDDGHYCTLEGERLDEYIRDNLSFDIRCRVADIQGVSHLEVDEDKIQEWVDNHIGRVYDYQEGSVDDYPFDAEGIAREYLEDIAK